MNDDEIVDLPSCRVRINGEYYLRMGTSPLIPLGSVLWYEPFDFGFNLCVKDAELEAKYQELLATRTR